MTKKTPRSTEGFTTLDSVLEAEGVRDAFQAIAIKEVLGLADRQGDEGAENLAQAATPNAWAPARSQISRLLDPTDGNVTLVTLQRAAELLGRSVRLELV